MMRNYEDRMISALDKRKRRGFPARIGVITRLDGAVVRFAKPTKVISINQHKPVLKLK